MRRVGLELLLSLSLAAPEAQTAQCLVSGTTDDGIAEIFRTIIFRAFEPQISEGVPSRKNLNSTPILSQEEAGERLRLFEKFAFNSFRSSTELPSGKRSFPAGFPRWR